MLFKNFEWFNFRTQFFHGYTYINEFYVFCLFTKFLLLHPHRYNRQQQTSFESQSSEIDAGLVGHIHLDEVGIILF